MGGAAFRAVFPARAGMILVQPDPQQITKSIPRESGDDPLDVLRGIVEDHVFPARAGMILRVFRSGKLDVRIPRESGDDPTSATLRCPQPKYSPRERG